ncbi:PA0069 family radical SAM protein [Bartonella tamiae]|uniref:Radical SAM core domain-containing protein n=1 Tax=Bartonella tamiae Th239 TaxID=1094558 RepID=J0QWV5_9HYPH|nr:PA0069 family radical SAM protein [Bartonella tamiae]EJF90506.1 hypothetical protein ME5_00907 [Bartonella tamiae Th239]EJF93550.1 hypothetical protein MEG_00974 [Bartonella tamiae Th307]
MKKSIIDQNLLGLLNQADDIAFWDHDVSKAECFIKQSLMRVSEKQAKGRGTSLNPSGRFETHSRVLIDDGWEKDEVETPLKTNVQIETARHIITHNRSPDLPFDRSINPYRGCEHGCVYCFARPSHAYMGLSSGLDFETKLFAKHNCATLLERELSKPSYKPKVIAIGTNTDPYQPIEKKWKLMREILQVLNKANHPVQIVTKSALITRDCDILKQMSQKGLVHVSISITSLDAHLIRAMEPRAATPQRRLWALEYLTKLNIPVSVMVAPIVPALNDHEIETILHASKDHGALNASYTILRLPYEVAPQFRDWLLREYPDRYRRIMHAIRDMRQGKDYDANWKTRMKGEGTLAQLIARRFDVAVKKIGFADKRIKFNFDLFRAPLQQAEQLNLFS